MLSVREKIAYGLGDTASNIVFQTVITFIAFFYTDIYGLSPAIVGVLLLSVRIFDAVTDPLMGVLTDRTQTKHGKFRPYILWLALPFGVITVATFTTPDFSENGKIIYAFVTYALLMAVYTAINIPYSALGGVLTDKPEERVSVQSYRFVFGMLGGLIVGSMTLPLVAYFGDGNNAKGYQLTMVTLSVFAVVMFLLCFAGTRERVVPPPTKGRKLREDFKSLWQNDQWRILSLAVFFLLTGMVARATLATYYVKYYMGLPDFITIFVTVGLVGSIIGTALSAPLARHVCKVKAYIWLQIISAILCAISFFIPGDEVFLTTAVFFVWSLMLQMATPLLWAKMADVVDYGHWKTGIRITGSVYSTIVFFLKLGVAVGGSVALWLLAYYGFEADAAPSDTTREGIKVLFTLFPIVFFLIVAAIMQKYRLTDSLVKSIHDELQEQMGESGSSPQIGSGPQNIPGPQTENT